VGSKIRVVIVDDHRHFRVGIKTEIEQDSQITVVGEGFRGEHVEQLVAECDPDVLILDLQMKQYEDSAKGNEMFSALPTILRLDQAYPELAIVIVSAHVSITLIEDAFSRGVRGYILKEEAEDTDMSRVVRFADEGRLVMSETIQHILLEAGRGVRHRPKLTERQLEIVRTLGKNVNAPNKVHADMLSVTRNGLRNQLTTIYSIMGVQNKTACIVECIRYGYISLDLLYYSG